MSLFTHEGLIWTPKGAYVSFTSLQSCSVASADLVAPFKDIAPPFTGAGLFLTRSLAASGPRSRYSALSQALRLAPESPYILARIGNAEFSLEECSGAREHWEKAQRVVGLGADPLLIERSPTLCSGTMR